MSRALRIAAVLLLGLAGCSILRGPLFRPLPPDAMPASKALVYVYRPHTFFGGPSYTVHAADRTVGKLVNGGYRLFFAEPGELEFWARTEGRSAVTELLEPGKTYYLRGSVGVGVLIGRPKLTFMPAEIGQREIAGCIQLR